MKKLIVGAVIVLVVVGAVFLVSNLNGIVKAAIESVGAKATGASVTVRDVALSATSGEGKLAGFHVGNPAGFETTSSFDMGELRLAIDPATIRADVIRIKEIAIDGAAITCEQKGLKDNNLRTLLRNIEAFAGSGGGKDSQTKVIIDKFSFTNGTVAVKAPGLGETTLPVPAVELTGIGQKSSGVTMAEAIPQLLNPIIKQTLGAVATANLKVPGLDKDALLGGLKDGTAGLLEGAKDAAKNLNPFKTK